MERDFEQNFNSEEKIPDTEIARKLQEAIKEKKAREGKLTDNPMTIDEATADLAEMAVEEKEKSELAKEQRLERMAELAVEPAFGKGVFEKETKTAKEQKPKYKPYPQSEIERIGKLIVDYKERFREAKTKDAKDVYQEKIKKLREDLEKAKAVRDKNKRKIEEQKEKEIRPQLRVDIGESQPKTYSGKVYSRENFPEDHAKF